MKSAIETLVDIASCQHQQLYLKNLLSSDIDISLYDYLILVRYVLQVNKIRGASQSVAIKAAHELEDAELERFSLKSIQQGTSSILALSPHKKPYLSDSDSWNQLDLVRQDESFEADKFFPYPTYFHKGQKEAVKALIEAKNGSTTVIQLPTGSGKSALFHLPLFLTPKEKHLNIVIVPTVALAMDQERRILSDKQLSSEFDYPLAWHSGLSDFDKEEMKTRIRNGTQRILFLNPETLTRSLVKVLFDANRTIRNFFIDEAHIIGEWGDSFRPDFQDLAVFRNALQKNNPFLRTFLLSATVNAYNANLIKEMFSDQYEKGVDFFSYNFMREEPRYFHYKVTSLEKKSVFLDVFRHLPRPLIIYTNTPTEAQAYGVFLRDNGHTSFKIFTGKTPRDERADILQAWNKDEINVIIATSAFGVGVDKPNVRAVMHVSIPETFDRYYQEVGRGGRDGWSSTALVLFSSEDLKVKFKIQRMGQDLAWSRWSRLCNESKVTDFMIEDQALQVFDLRVRDSHIKKQSEMNEFWNAFVMRLMDNKKFIKRHILAIEEFALNISSSEDDDDFFSEYKNKVPIEFLKEMYLDEDTFKETYSKSEATRITSREASFLLLLDFLNKKISMEDALSQTYDLDSLGIVVSKACRGCHAHPEPKTRIRIPQLRLSSLHNERNQNYSHVYYAEHEGTDAKGYIFYDPDEGSLDYVGFLVRSLEIVEVIFHGSDFTTFKKMRSIISRENKNRPVFFEVSLPADRQLSMDRPQLAVFGSEQAQLPNRDDLLGAANCLVLVPKTIKLDQRLLIEQLPSPFSLSDYARIVSK